jgi:hypothetical protein
MSNVMLPAVRVSMTYSSTPPEEVPMAVLDEAEADA